MANSVGRNQPIERHVDATTPSLPDERKGQPKDSSNVLPPDPEVTAIYPSDYNLKRRHLIEFTSSMVRNQTSTRHFVQTKAFHAAKERLRADNLVIIKGNSGDGKSYLAVHLLSWLASGDDLGNDRRKRPMQIYEHRGWDDVAPKLDLAIYIDDLFGDKALSRKEFEEWLSREVSIQSALCGNLHENANCLIITIQNDVFNTLNMSSSKLFRQSNIIDLSSNYSLTEKEKINILHLYTESLENFVKFSTQEKVQIVTCNSLYTGFPQCCRLFRDIHAVQQERANFSHKPLQFMENALLALSLLQRTVLWFLFVSGGTILENDFLPGKQIDIKLLNETVATDADKEEIPNVMTYEEKKDCVRKSLDSLVGSVVIKESRFSLENRNTQPSKYSVYRFMHDSVQKSIANIYGKANERCYIQNCPDWSLNYIATIKDAPSKVYVAPGNTHLYERILREVKCSEPRKFKVLATLDLWKDSQFLVNFFEWLDCRINDKDFHLVWTAREEKPYYQLGDSECNYSFIVYVAGENQLCLLKRLLMRTPKQHLQLKHALSQACLSGAEDCASYLLCWGVEPDEYTHYCAVFGNRIQVFKNLIDTNAIQAGKAKWSKSPYWRSHDLNVLHEACLLEREEMIKMLAKTYPFLIHERDGVGQSVLHQVANTGNCSLYRKIEDIVLCDMSEISREQHLCKIVDRLKRTVLHRSCRNGHRDLSLYLCHTYPLLMLCRDRTDGTCLHKIAQNSNSTVEFYTLIENCFKHCQEAKGETFDLTTLLTKENNTVLHLSCQRKNIDLSLHFCKKYPELMLCKDKEDKLCLHYIADLKSYPADFYIAIESCIKKYIQSKGICFDVKTMNNADISALDLCMAKESKTGDDSLDNL